MKKQVFLILGVLILSLILGSCNAIPFLMNQLDTSSSNRLPTFDLSGARAVGVTDNSSRYALGRSTTDDLEGFEGFVKLLDNGQVIPAIQFHDNNHSNDEIAFIMRGEDGSVYLGFNNGPFNYFPELDLSTTVQLVRIYPESTFENTLVEIVWPDPAYIPQNNPWNYPRMDMNSWNNQIPVVKAPDGSFYFKTSNWGSGSDGGNAIFSYEPGNKKVTRITPENLNLSIDAFVVGPDNRLYFNTEDKIRTTKPGVQGTGTIGTASHMYLQPEFSVAPDGALLVRDQNELRRVEIEENSHEILVDSQIIGSSLQYFQNQHLEGLIDHWNGNINEALIRNTSNGWGTYDQIENYQLVPAVWDLQNDTVNIPAFVNKFRHFFVFGSLEITPALQTYLEGYASPSAVDSLLDEKTLYHWLRNDGLEFISTYFTGTTWNEYLNSRGFDENTTNFNIGSTLWLSDGSLIAVSNNIWGWEVYNRAEFYQILNKDGNFDLQLNTSVHMNDLTIKETRIVGDVLYYVYDIFNSVGNASGKMNIGSMNMLTGEEKIGLVPSQFSDAEFRTWAVADDNSLLYFMGWNTSNNEVINARINLVTGSAEKLSSPYVVNKLTVIK